MLFNQWCANNRKNLFELLSWKKVKKKKAWFDSKMHLTILQSSKWSFLWRKSKQKQEKFASLDEIVFEEFSTKKFRCFFGVLFGLVWGGGGQKVPQKKTPKFFSAEFIEKNSENFLQPPISLKKILKIFYCWIHWKKFRDFFGKFEKKTEKKTFFCHISIPGKKSSYWLFHFKGGGEQTLFFIISNWLTFKQRNIFVFHSNWKSLKMAAKSFNILHPAQF